jgi:4-hydroxybenzoate polyprenyltransferase
MRVGQWLQLCLLVALVFSQLIAAAAMRHSQLSPKLPWILFFAFLLLAYSFFWYSIRNRRGTHEGSLSQSATTAKNSFMASALFRGGLYLFTGGVAILGGVMVPRDKAVFLLPGVVTCCFGFYFLLIAKKSRRDAGTAAKSFHEKAG